jgi:xanthine dehydrogenase YagS FAD-binding subunit
VRHFKLAEPRTLEQAASLADGGAGSVFFLAGGTDLLGEIKDEIIEPDLVIDMRTVPDLSFIREEGSGLRIGALTTLGELAEDSVIKNSYPGLHQALLSTATPQIRNVGTIGGNLCQRPRCWYYRDSKVNCRKKGGSRCFALQGKNKYHAILGGGLCYIVHPSDLAPVLVALGAAVFILTPKGEKTLPIQDFFTLPRVNVRRENILGPSDIVKEIQLPLPKEGQKSTYSKFKERGTWDFAVVSAAVCGVLSGSVFKELRMVAGGIAPVPWRLGEAEQRLKGKKISGTQIREAVRADLADAKPLSDNVYKIELLETVFCRAVLSLL